MSTNVIRGMDHVGITVSDIDEATRFFSDAFGAEVIYDSVSPSDDDVKGEETENILNLFPGTKITTVRMMKLKHGPGLELFEMKGPEQSQPVRPAIMACSILPFTLMTSTRLSACSSRLEGKCLLLLNP